MAFDKNRYNNEYKKMNYTRTKIMFPKGKKALLKQRADELGISVNQLIIRALETQYHLGLVEEEPINQPR